jgi:fatty-acyl-CoA synthase
VVLAAEYGVPDAEAGDRVMAALQRGPAQRSIPTASRRPAAQPDLSSKWAPTYVRVVAALRRSETNKVVKRAAARGFLADGADALWWVARRRRLSPFGTATCRRCASTSGAPGT